MPGKAALPRAGGGPGLTVLVAYATRHGSTRQVAQTVSEVLQERGARVTLRPASAVRESVARFDLVVLGAPLYSGRWHRDAHRFLRRHRRELSGLPVAVFGMGPRTDTEEAWQHSRAQLDKALARRGWLTPVTITVFGGADPPGDSKRRRRDLRNWDTIGVWAAQLPGVPAVPSAGTAGEASTVEHGRGDPPAQPVQENQYHGGGDGQAG
jgi:menaquinone-dependent protoporphyrinogen oxidase